MIKRENKNEARRVRHRRMRDKRVIFKLAGTAARPRLNVYRSNAHIYAQLIDDEAGRTLVSSSSVAKDADFSGKTKTETAAAVGAELAKKAAKLKIKDAVFDRGGYLYTGRVKALADGARQAGLKF
ncbi:MAG: 50S ribosomal protein L18 [Clostridiales bacterium]|jgi:large subunit ribosomal protein L18|nr:50S ribosomal protein L18 [Clostridiales bacterium]